jgi:hypothetical protein
MSPHAGFSATSSRPGVIASVRHCLRAPAVGISLFLCLWFVYGVTANSRNQFEFNLQHAGIEAMVERHHFYLEGSSTPRFQMKVYYDGDRPFGDVFLYQGHQYAAKQPGQFMAGAIAYSFLHLLGLDYSHHYLLTSALVSFLTTSLLTALAAVAIFATVRELTGRERVFWPLLCALIYGVGTTAFVYAGITYHDSLASAYLAIAFYFAVLLARRQPGGRSAKLLAAGCGLLLGFTVTTSMLPFFMACVVGLYVVSLRRWGLSAVMVAAGIVGIAPLLIYNSISFGSPFLNSYVAGGYPESMLHLDFHNSVEKLRLYLSEITFYVPIAWLGILGLMFFPQSLRRERLVLIGLLIAQAIQVLNIESHGGCHYGPRFLLAAMPFVCAGLGGFSYLRAKASKLLSISATLILGAVSVLISAMGALYTAMYCDVGRYALWPALQNFRDLDLKDFPLAPWLGLPLLLTIILLAYSIRNSRRPVRS